MKDTTDKKGMESRHDGRVMINWNNKTIITDLGIWGTYVCSFDQHNAIQRAYVYDGSNETGAEVAMNFDFPHTKSVYVYARLHGFSKASIPQTDLEFEMGLTEEQAIEENIQNLKRKVTKKTERKKWQLTQKWADKWTDFHHTVLKPFENWVEEFAVNRKIPRLKLNKKEKQRQFAYVVGLSDIHYMKLCYSATGKVIYNRKIAERKVDEHVRNMISTMIDGGVPEKIYIPVGSDNIHVDNELHTTTRGTNQVQSTDGQWRLELSNYMDITIDYIDRFAQVANVEIVPMFGNHDKRTAYLMLSFLEKYYKKTRGVTVNNRYHARNYFKYGRTVLCFSHGDEISLAKLQKEAHKLVFTEARQQKVSIDTAVHVIIFTGHLHFDLFTELGGGVKHFIIPSMSLPDDWHKDNGFDSTPETALYKIDRYHGRSAIFYNS
ncbi:hypothetical protein N8148_03080 [Gammaproteobacteria bacterium]|nr:hypothetical protein [Gammaproteobacteria bacterium]